MNDKCKFANGFQFFTKDKTCKLVNANDLICNGELKDKENCPFWNNN